MGGIQACHAGTLGSASEWVSGYLAAGAQEVVVRVAAPDLRGWEEKAQSLLRTLRGH